MCDSALIRGLVSPALVEELSRDARAPRGPDQLLGDARSCLAVVNDENRLSISDTTKCLCRCAGLLLAICEPYAPVSAREQQAGLLTYALQMWCSATRHVNESREDELTAGGLDSINEKLHWVTDALINVELSPDDPVRRSVLLDSCLTAGVSCLLLAGLCDDLAHEGCRASAPL